MPQIFSAFRLIETRGTHITERAAMPQGVSATVFSAECNRTGGVNHAGFPNWAYAI